MKIEIEIDDAREVMYEELDDEFGVLLEETLENTVAGQLTQMYDNRDAIRKELQG